MFPEPTMARANGINLAAAGFTSSSSATWDDASVVVTLPAQFAPGFPFPGAAPGGSTMDGRARIAVIDDERTIRAHLKAVLEQEGYQVETAADGEEGLALVRAARPRLKFAICLGPGADRA